VFRITSQPIDLAAVRSQLLDTGCGAYVQFEGWVRDHNEGQQVLRLEYEVYEPLAIKEGQRILDEAMQRFGLRKVTAIHRSGMLELTDVAVIVGAASPHRGEAFDGCRYIIDQLKSRLPIWKKEHYANGMAEWVNCQRCAEAGHQHEQ
jgi:molybdopterin synthase catalytic subunit